MNSAGRLKPIAYSPMLHTQLLCNSNSCYITEFLVNKLGNFYIVKVKEMKIIT